MLAKTWKKFLLAICIIACVYNVMHKLVGRTSLEVQLKSVENQGSIINIVENTPSKTQPNNQNSSAVKNTTNTNQNHIVVVY